MKILIIYGGFKFNVGGVNQHAENLKKGFEILGHSSEIIRLDSLPIYLRYIPHIVERAINIINFPTGFYYKGRVTQFLYRMIIKKQDYDALIFEDIYIGWKSEAKSMTWMHAVWSDNLHSFEHIEYADTKLKFLEVKLINDTKNTIATVSHEYRSFLINEHFKSKLRKSIDVIPLGIDQSNFKQQSSNQIKPNLIYCGALEKRKNISFLLKVYEKVKKTLPESSLTIIGDGPDSKELRKVSKENNLDVNFLGKRNHGELIKELYKNSIYIHTSKKESFSYSLLESKLAGLITIAHDQLQVPYEFIDIRVKKFDVNEWHQAIIQAVQGVMREANLSGYTLEAMAKNTLNKLQ